jgi:hypothetical protein
MCLFKFAPHNVDSFIDKISFARADSNLVPFSIHTLILFLFCLQPLLALLLYSFELLFHCADN